MELPESLTGEIPSPSRKEVQLQGPRPSPLKISKASHKIRKPPVAPAAKPAAAAAEDANRQPVIIYALSPKVIHTTSSDFMSLVQRLTGSSNSGDVSPAARIASIERTSPQSHSERSTSQVMDMVQGLDLDVVSQMPGILSPAPSTLPAIPSSFFSPDPHTLSWVHDLSSSPSIYGYSNMFIPSPSTLFSAPMVSPSPSSFDLLNHLFNY